MANQIDLIFERINLLDDKERIKLLYKKLEQLGVTNLSPNSWIYFKPKAITCTAEQFNDFWNLCPTEHHEVKIFGKLTPIPRFQKLYGNASYNFSGVEMKPDPIIPELVQRCIDYARKHWPQLPNGTLLEWNGALVNWYPNGLSYIGPHSDDVRDLMPNVPILSFSFGGVRTFRVKYKLSNKNESIVSKKDFQTEHCSLIAMGGSMQAEYKHEITKTSKEVKPRINITIRCFKKN